MSGFLAATFLLLLLGLLITAVLAWQRRRYHYETATGMVLIAVAVWLVAGRSLPLVAAIGKWSFQVDQIAWQLSLYVLLLVLATLIFLSAPSVGNEPDPVNRFTWLARPSAILLLTATTLLVLWADSLAGLLTTWTLQTLAWTFLLAVAGSRTADVNRLLLRGSTLLFSLVFLWLAAVALDRPSQAGLDMGSWPVQARTWILLAAVTQLGALPLHWWRPLKWSLPAASAALIHTMPAVVGGSLLARLALNAPAGIGYTLFLTTFAFLGLLVAVGRAWIHLRRPGIAVANLAMAQASVVVLVGAWAGSEAVVAELGVMVLAIGGLFLANAVLKGTLAWLRAPAVAAIAGIPLTAGFIGLATLYNNWVSGGLFLLLLVTTLLYVPLIAAAIVAPRGERRDQDEPTELRNTVWIVAGQLLLAAGLVAIPIPLAGQTSPFAWLAIILATAAGIALSRQSEWVQQAPAGLQRAFHLDLPGDRLYQYAASLGSFTGNAIREAVAILEGEGGLLWLIILLVVVWLAGIG
jgi:hypothetical protein